MKRNDSRAIARLKRMYKRLKDYPLIKKKDGKWRACESVTEFLSLKWTKVFKNTGSYTRGVSDKLDAKQKNRRERYSEKKQIQEGIEEYTDMSKYDCSSCIYEDKGHCEKDLPMKGEDCPEYWD